MALLDTFSRRKRQNAGTGVDVYQYDQFPTKIRVQIVQIIVEIFGDYRPYSNSESFWDTLVELMRKEKGVFHLTNGYDQIQEEFCNWLIKEDDIDSLLDGVEIAFRLCNSYCKKYGKDFGNINSELNARLQEAAIGYEYVSNQIVRIDNYVTHSEIVVPALTLLMDKEFSSANIEYLRAHDAFRAGDYEDTLVECGKAFESVLKIIGEARGWGNSPNDTASKLVASAFSSGFVPQYMQSQFTGLRSMLDSGIATVRNKMGAHGAGVNSRQVDKHLAAYQLHQTAAAIVFLVEHHRLVE